MNKNEQYSRFAQYYIETADELKGLADEMEELTSVGKTISRELSNEYFRLETIIEILTQAGEELYNKTPKQLYQDGWNFWFKEDAELREKNYGEKIIVRTKKA